MGTGGRSAMWERLGREPFARFLSDGVLSRTTGRGVSLFLTDSGRACPIGIVCRFFRALGEGLVGSDPAPSCPGTDGSGLCWILLTWLDTRAGWGCGLGGAVVGGAKGLSQVLAPVSGL